MNLKFFLIVLTILFCASPMTVLAEELEPEFDFTNKTSISALTDTSHDTTVVFNEGVPLNISAKDGSLISGIYICWDTEPAPWKLTTTTGEKSCGKYGFLHEYIPLENPTSKVTIHIPKNNTKIDTIRIFSEGELPADIQTWEPSCEKADIMVISTHADDELLFMGGILPTYAYLPDVTVQVIYLCEFRSTNQDIREHEKLDGLWEAGIRHYPVSGNFTDKYAKDYAAAKKIYNESEVEEFFTEQIRRFKPQVIVTHDTKGEYGHGAHILVCNTVLDAIHHASDTLYHPESVELYGIWDVPKTYLHLYPEHKIRLDLHIPIEEDDTKRTAIEILKDAYKKHISQQKYWFYVSDEYEYSCADFGLVRSLVGADVTNDILCNIIPYKVQERNITEKRLEEEKQQQLEQQKETAQLETIKCLDTEKQLLKEAISKLETQLSEKEEITISLKENLASLEQELVMTKKVLSEIEIERQNLQLQSEKVQEDNLYLQRYLLFASIVFIGLFSFVIIKIIFLRKQTKES